MTCMTKKKKVLNIKRQSNNIKSKLVFLEYKLIAIKSFKFN